MHTGGTLTSIRDENNQLASGQHSAAFKKQVENEIAEAKLRARSRQRLTDRQALLAALVSITILNSPTRCRLRVRNITITFLGIRSVEACLGRGLSRGH